MLVDLSGEPRVLGAMTVHGQHVDARQTGSVVRLVVRSQPEIAFPPAKPDASEKDLLDGNRKAVLSAPGDAWLPSYDVESGGVHRTERVGCDRVSHPDEFTGTSMLTIHTIDLAAATPFGALTPIAVAADGDTVYGTASSLYVTSNPRWWDARPIDVLAGARVVGRRAHAERAARAHGGAPLRRLGPRHPALRRVGIGAGTAAQPILPVGVRRSPAGGDDQRRRGVRRGHERERRARARRRRRSRRPARSPASAGASGSTPCGSWTASATW